MLMDDDFGFSDILPPLPPPVDYDVSAPPDYIEKGDAVSDVETPEPLPLQLPLTPVPLSLCTVMALYSYEATKPDDLSLVEGDVIYLTRRHDDGWCEGVLNGNHGFFPSNYVESCG